MFRWFSGIVWNSSHVIESIVDGDDDDGQTNDTVGIEQDRISGQRIE